MKPLDNKHSGWLELGREKEDTFRDFCLSILFDSYKDTEVFYSQLLFLYARESQLPWKLSETTTGDNSKSLSMLSSLQNYNSVM